MGFSPDHRTIAVVSIGSNFVTFIDTATNAVKHTGYVGLENDDKLTAIDALSNKAIATVPIGQAPQAVSQVPDAGPEGPGTAGLEQLGLAGQAPHFTMVPAGGKAATGIKAPASVTLFDQGLVRVLPASATGLEPRHPYVPALSERADRGGKLEALAGFMTNPAGAAIVSAVGPIRRIVQGGADAPRRYLVIAPGSTTKMGKPVQVQSPS